MILTIDASVAVKLIVDEPGSLKAAAYLPKYVGATLVASCFLIAPSLIALELHNVMAKRYRNGSAKYSQLYEAELLLQKIARIDSVDAELIDRARIFSLGARAWLRPPEEKRPREFEVPYNIYDCIYLAHAKKYNSALLTADSELARIAQAINIPVEFIPTV